MARKKNDLYHALCNALEKGTRLPDASPALTKQAGRLAFHPIPQPI